MVMSGGKFSFIQDHRRVHTPIFEEMSLTGKAGIVERAYGAQNLLNARTEATNARQTVLLEIKCQTDYGVGEKSANRNIP
jgi:hypothetical protein